ncbi:nucleotidyltransferase domain-containing protein [Sulfitobacter sp. AS92]|uniref:nucleotidyltransferase domain-containing protein n=1 Tax=Sulfitobacter sp. AS92 TaxID=3135783 RepID=UPI00317453E4
MSKSLNIKPDMSKTTDIIQRRAADRQRTAMAAWREIKADLEAVGLEPTLFGSLANGGFRAHSDIDVLVKLGDSGMSRSAVDRIVSKASHELPVDLIIEEDLTESDLEALLADIGRTSKARFQSLEKQFLERMTRLTTAS